MIGAPAGRRASGARGLGGVWLGTVGLLTVATGISLATPPIANAQLRAALGQALGTSNIQVRMATWPGPALLWGRVDVLSVAARHLRVGTLDVDAFDATLNRVRLDPEALFGSHAVVVRSLGSGVAHVTVTQGALTALLGDQPSLRNVVVALQSGRVSMEATISVLGAPLRATGTGRLVLRGDRAVDLVVDELTVAGVSLPPAVSAEVVRSVNPVLDVRSLPFGLHLTGVTVAGGRVVLDAVAGL